MTEWLCREDLDKLWNDQCIFGVCDDEAVTAEAYRLFLGQCIEVSETHICPGQVWPVHEITDEMLGSDARVIGDSVLGLNHIQRSFGAGRCFKVASTFFCDDDIPELFRTGCMRVHHHEGVHRVFDVCQRDFVRLLHGGTVNVGVGDGEFLLKAHFSSDFNDLSHECIQTEANRYTCWGDIDALYSEKEECALYANTWICYLPVRHAWHHGGCLAIDGMDVCDRDFHLVAQRKCVTLSDGNEYCPSALGMHRAKNSDVISEHDHLFITPS